MSVFLFLNLGWAIIAFAYKSLTGAHHANDYGDHYHELIKGVEPQADDTSPDVYWIIFDEYASRLSLENVWNFKNPLDSILKKKGFHIIDSATSNYNYTTFSIISTMDMVYLKNIRNHTKGTPRDMAKSIYAVKETNVVTLFDKMGYSIANHSLWDYKNHPTKNDKYFDYVPSLLLEVKTLEKRTNRDIGWNFRRLWAPSLEVADSIVEWKNLLAIDHINDAQVENTHKELQRIASSKKKTFAVFHFNFPHEPYMYDSSGNIVYEQGTNHVAKNYLKHLVYTNKVIDRLTDSLVAISRKKNAVIILQGDHGFKFNEDDPEFETEGCKILYALLSSDSSYSSWPGKMSSVNGFRILFNKYFKTSFDKLPDTSYNIVFRKE